MTAREARHSATLAKWREIVIACRSSGLSVHDWCEQEGVGLRSYYRHEREFLDLISTEQCGLPASLALTNSPVFAELSVPKNEIAIRPAGQAAATVRIGGVATDIFDGAAEETLRTLLRVLKDAE
ncbi:MAG: hypothetical protein IKE11_08765 [Clostridia bacterium]|nr:hypothetical protein [Clostridia bacterium]